MSDIAGEAVQLANRVTGSLMSAYSIGTEANEGETEVEDVVISDGTVKFDLVETEDVTNGMLVITFDADVLTFQELTSAAAIYAINTSEAAEGRIVVAYAAASAISAGDVLARLTFLYEGEYVTTEVTLSTEQRNEEDQVSEDDTVVEIDNYVPSGDNTLKDLTVQEGTLTPDFDSEVTEYVVEVPYDVEDLTIDAVANDEKATVEISDTALTAGGATVITVTVTAENGDVKVYSITVNRNACTHEHTEVRGAEDANCTEDGYTGDIWCLDCQTMIGAGEVIAATGHSYVDGECENCGEADPDYKDPSQTPDSGDRIIWVVFAALLSALGLVALPLKKKEF